jgi:hypothetical protein
MAGVACLKVYLKGIRLRKSAPMNVYLSQSRVSRIMNELEPPHLLGR